MSLKLLHRNDKRKFYVEKDDDGVLWLSVLCGLDSKNIVHIKLDREETKAFYESPRSITKLAVEIANAPGKFYQEYLLKTYQQKENSNL